MKRANTHVPHSHSRVSRTKQYFLLLLSIGLIAIATPIARATNLTEEQLTQSTADFASYGYEDGSGGGYVIAGSPVTRPRVVSGTGNNRTNHTKIGCSPFANAVLHRVLKGDYKNIDSSLHQAFGGAAIARGYELSSAGDWTLDTFIQAAGNGQLPAGVFYFDLRNRNGWKNGRDTAFETGMAGHVGFVVIELKDGKNTVKQYQMTEKEHGLASGTSFLEYLTWSEYGRTSTAKSTSRIELYRL